MSICKSYQGTRDIKPHNGTEIFNENFNDFFNNRVVTECVVC